MTGREIKARECGEHEYCTPPTPWDYLAGACPGSTGIGTAGYIRDAVCVGCVLLHCVEAGRLNWVLAGSTGWGALGGIEDTAGGSCMQFLTALGRHTTTPPQHNNLHLRPSIKTPSPQENDSILTFLASGSPASGYQTAL
ncbi:hypothetical protein JB92DRAFT_2833459 [Gautieria morchelliformis]|nr:hypothetical protein JB92DRAFT_2833459 [Gautieria morchelliformis]